MRVFLSYHSPDRESALALKRAIEQTQSDAEVFVDQTGLRYGHFWQPALSDAIAKSAAFIILVSNSIRAYLAEFGIVAPVGRKGVAELLHVVADPSDKRVPEIARACLPHLAPNCSF